MIAADTSTWIAFFEAQNGRDTWLLDKGLQERQVVMVPVVITELLSDPQLPADIAETLAQIPSIDIAPGYWQRAGALRAKVLSRHRKARLGDALIAQCCVDANLRLITRDRDFLTFVDVTGLDVVFR